MEKRGEERKTEEKNQRMGKSNVASPGNALSIRRRSRSKRVPHKRAVRRFFYFPTILSYGPFMEPFAFFIVRGAVPFVVTKRGRSLPCFRGRTKVRPSFRLTSPAYFRRLFRSREGELPRRSYFRNNRDARAMFRRSHEPFHEKSRCLGSTKSRRFA